MPKLCEQLTWLNELKDRAMNTQEDERYITAIRRILIAAEQMRDRLVSLIEKISGEGE